MSEDWREVIGIVTVGLWGGLLLGFVLAGNWLGVTLVLLVTMLFNEFRRSYG